MNFEDKVLFEQYFNITRTTGGYASKKVLDFVINLLLNSKEFKNSSLKISNNDVEVFLLSLSVKSINVAHNKLNFYATYYVSDGQLSDNRDIIGSIIIQDGKVFMLSNIHSFELNRDVELGEVFELNLDETYSIFSSYNMDYSNSIRKIEEDDFDKFDSFKEEVLRLIKSGKRG